MKNDLPDLMKREDIDAIWVLGPGTHNPAMTYLTGGANLGNAEIIQIRGKEPILFCRSMEREEAASSGLKTVIVEKYGKQKLLEETGGDENKAGAILRKRMLEELGFTQGRIAIYGKTDLSWPFGIFNEMRDILPEIQLIGEGPSSILLEARATKDIDEIQRIRKMGELTTQVVGKTANYLQSCQIRDDEVLLNEEGIPLTIGEIKSKIHFWVVERGAENPKEPIFAIGRDAGIPHSVGNPEDVLRLGKTIVFDIFPQEAGGGYFFDFTRTWCLGYAPKEITDLYNDVRSVFDTIMKEIKVNEFGPNLQDRTCELFEKLGHKTIRQDPQLESGYVHSLFHGVGLDVHERPRSSRAAKPEDKLAPGSVVTIEPGLYYPERGMGCRIEDLVWVRPEGEFEILAPYPYDLVLLMDNW